MGREVGTGGKKWVPMEGSGFWCWEVDIGGGNSSGILYI